MHTIFRWKKNVAYVRLDKMTKVRETKRWDKVKLDIQVEFCSSQGLAFHVGYFRFVSKRM